MPKYRTIVKDELRYREDLSGGYAPLSTVNLLSSAVSLINSATFDPRDYGALFDGVSDDGPGINSALVAASAAGGGIVPLRAAYTVTGNRVTVNTTIRMRSGAWLMGSGTATVLQGTASPMISFPTSGTVIDRWTISDMLLQSPPGIGIRIDQSGLTGGHQLGWSRGWIQNVTIVDAAGDSFYCATGVIETRFVNCVSARSRGIGFNIMGTDNSLSLCTSFGDGGSNSTAGFVIDGGNTKLTACKAYGHAGDGFVLQGGGRHMMSSCESQDNGRYGFALYANSHVLSSCIADSDKSAGFYVSGWHTLTGCSVLLGGGGLNQITPIGFLLFGNCAGTIINGTCHPSMAMPVAGSLDGASITIKGSEGRQTIFYASTITPEPYQGSTVFCKLTGNVTVGNPTKYHAGQTLRLVLEQDLTGGRAVTWGSAFVADAVVTTARTATTVNFIHDGRKWRQTSAQIGQPSSSGIVDTFTRADSAVTLGSTEGATTVAWTARAGTWGVSSNAAYTTGSSPAWAIATVPGNADGEVGVTITAGCDGTSSPAVIFRYVDNNNYWYWAPRSAVVRKKVAGVESSYPVVPIGMVAPSNGTRCRVRFTGATIEFFQDETSIHTLVDTSHQSATLHGIGCTDYLNPSLSRFDNFFLD